MTEEISFQIRESLDLITANVLKGLYFYFHYKYIVRDGRSIYITRQEPRFEGYCGVNTDKLDLIVFGFGKYPDEVQLLTESQVKEIKKLYIPDRQGLSLHWLAMRGWI